MKVKLHLLSLVKESTFTNAGQISSNFFSQDSPMLVKVLSFSSVKMHNRWSNIYRSLQFEKEKKKGAEITEKKNPTTNLALQEEAVKLESKKI